MPSTNNRVKNFSVEASSRVTVISNCFNAVLNSSVVGMLAPAVYFNAFLNSSVVGMLAPAVCFNAVLNTSVVGMLAPPVCFKLSMPS